MGEAHRFLGCVPRSSTGKEALRNIASRRSVPRIRISGGTTIALLGEPYQDSCLSWVSRVSETFWPQQNDKLRVEDRSFDMMWCLRLGLPKSTC